MNSYEFVKNPKLADLGKFLPEEVSHKKMFLRSKNFSHLNADLTVRREERPRLKSQTNIRNYSHIKPDFTIKHPEKNPERSYVEQKLSQTNFVNRQDQYEIARKLSEHGKSLEIVPKNNKLLTYIDENILRGEPEKIRETGRKQNLEIQTRVSETSLNNNLTPNLNKSYKFFEENKAPTRKLTANSETSDYWNFPDRRGSVDFPTTPKLSIENAEKSLSQIYPPVISQGMVPIGKSSTMEQPIKTGLQRKDPEINIGPPKELQRKEFEKIIKTSFVPIKEGLQKKPNQYKVIPRKLSMMSEKPRYIYHKKSL